ncbi:hypothetical protein [Mesorhizobium temperatum]|uniref:Uncharacterized protein n=1 Tax=Mesorhizobium temperatum TaxID=241416 RepID=A0A271LUH5_9HYPH|nr:hypothetical protein [Mesorhizobium temperatum]PAQ11714.1 hypothetical protein CIT26_03355 [Mesorhizobium temperatum]
MKFDWLNGMTTLVPGGIVIFVSKWTELLSDTGLTHPQWKVQATNLGVALSTFLILIIAFFLTISGGRYLMRIAKTSIGIFFLALVLCFVFRELARVSPSQANADIYKLMWYFAYVAMLVSFAPAIGTIGTALKYATLPPKQ